MAKGIIFLLVCIVLTLLGWGVFQLLGQYTFLVMLLITLSGLVYKVGAPRFGSKR